MGYETLAPGNAITSTWANNEVRDQVISVFASSAARTLAVTSPKEGMFSYIESSNLLTYYNGTTWVHAPGTLICRADRQSTSTTTTTEVGVLELPSVPISSGSACLIATPPLWLASTVPGDAVAAYIRYTDDGSAPTTASTQLPGGLCQATVSAYYETRSITTIFPGSATYRFLLTCARTAGTGTVRIVGSATNRIGIYAIALGADPGDTGVDI